MPPLVLGFLVILVGLYVVLAGAAWMGFLWARQEMEPTAPSTWPVVSVVVPVCVEHPEATLKTLRACDYPPERLDVVLLHSSTGTPSLGEEDEDMSVRFVSVETRDEDERTLERGLDAARGEVVLRVPPNGTLSSRWVRAMVQYCTDGTPIVVGPTVVEHDDRFLPRLQALQHLGHQAFSGGLSHLGLPLGPGTKNRAVCLKRLSSQEARVESPQIAPTDSAALYAPNPDTIVHQSPVSSFTEYVQAQARWFGRSFQFPSRIIQGRAVGLWLLHAVLLACSVVAIGLPAWRQPTLLALVGKMGADVVLTLPAAKLYGQRGLLRSIVPTELMQVLSIPLAGLWALRRPSSPH